MDILTEVCGIGLGNGNVQQFEGAVPPESCCVTTGQVCLQKVAFEWTVQTVLGYYNGYIHIRLSVCILYFFSHEKIVVASIGTCNSIQNDYLGYFIFRKLTERCRFVTYLLNDPCTSMYLCHSLGEVWMVLSQGQHWQPIREPFKLTHGRRPTPKSGGDQIGKLLVRKT